MASSIAALAARDALTALDIQSAGRVAETPGSHTSAREAGSATTAGQARSTTIAGQAGPPATADPAASAATADALAAAVTGAPLASAGMADPPASTARAQRLVLPPGLPAAQVHAGLRRCLKQMAWAEQSAFLWFTEMAQRRLYRELGYASLQAYAAAELDLSPNRVNRYLRLMQDLERLPPIRAALGAGAIGWTKARAIVRVSGPATEARWLAAARRLSRRELEAKGSEAPMRSAARRRGAPAQSVLAVAGGGGQQPAVVVGVGSGERAQRGGAAGRGEESERAGTASGNGESERVESARGGEPRGWAAARPLEPVAPNASGALAREAGAHANRPTSPFECRRADAGSEHLLDEGPVAVLLRFLPIDLARFEAQLEKVRKQGQLAAGASREEIVLHALEALIARGRRGSPGGSGSPTHVGPEGAADGPAGGADGRADDPAGGSATTGPAGERDIVPRGTAATPYQIIIYKCEMCQAAVVQTQRGSRPVGRARLEAAECDATVSEPGKPNRSAIPPSVRRVVLTRDRHRCRAAGCGSTGFLEVHHVVPRGRGGTNRAGNLVTLCARCHGLWHEKNIDVRLLRPLPA